MKHLTRSSKNGLILGVCGGLGEYLGVDTTIIRMIAVVIGMFWLPLVIVYFIVGLLMPKE